MSQILINPEEVDAVAKDFLSKHEQSQQIIHRSYFKKLQDGRKTPPLDHIFNMHYRKLG